MSAIATTVRGKRPVSDAWTLTIRVLLFYRNSPGLIGMSLGAPLVMLVMFGYVFGSAIRIPGGEDYRSYLMPGLFVLIAVNGIMASMVGAARDLERGMTDRLRTLPISRTATLLGQAVADVMVNAVIMVLMAGVGYAVGWRVHDGAAKAIGALGLLLLLRFAVVWVGFFLGMACRREEIAAQAGLLVLPVSTVSNVYVPTAGMPGWLRTIADWNPVSCATSAARSLFGDTIGAAATSPWPLAHPIEATFAWSAVLLALFMPLAVRAFSTHGR